MGKIVEVGIFTDGDLFIKSIGEELIKENHKNINFSFFDEQSLIEPDYLILNYKNKGKVNKCNAIFLSENFNDGGIFLFQAKGKIKKEILNIIRAEDMVNEFEVISGISPYNLAYATLFNHFLASRLSKEGLKVCFLSLNINFPYKYLGWNLDNKGLLKAIYYYQNKEKFNPGIISKHQSDNYYFVEMDLKINEVDGISEDFIKMLLEFFKTEEFRYVVFDYGIFYWQISNFSDSIFYLQNNQNTLLREMENNNLSNMNTFTNQGRNEIIEIDDLDNVYVIKNGKLSFNCEMEDIKGWKRSLKRKLLKN
ncbi:MAG: hypothetical protein PHQ32_03145 [Firmicutes bacterium]|nr:hypothetical protein [Bacillota bacterium]